MKRNNVTMTGKLQEIATIYSLSVAELIAQYSIDAVVPGICMNEGCDFVTEYEPDQAEGWCEECETNSVTSVLVLGGII